MTVRITENDPENDPAPTSINLSVSPNAVSEGAGDPSVTVTGTLIGGTRTTATIVTVTVAGGTATAVTDFAAVSDIALTVAAEESSGQATFTLTPVGDAEDEPDETVLLTGTTSVGGLTVSGTSLTITDDDEPSTLTGEFEDKPTTHDGQNAFTLRVRFTLAISISYVVFQEHSFEVSGGTVSGARRVEGSSALWEITVLPSGTGAVEIALPEERPCTEQGAVCTAGAVRLSNRPEATIAGPPELDSGTESELLAVRYGAANYQVAEGGTVAVMVTLSGDPEGEVTIPLTKSNGGGATGSDYGGVPSSVSFAAGALSRTFTVTAIDDAANDDGERVELGFGVLPSGLRAGIPATAVVSITDNDAPVVATPRAQVPVVTVSYEAVGYVVSEGSEVEVSVTLSGAPRRVVTIPLTTVNRGGATAADYTGVPTSVRFAPGATQRTFTVAAVNDAVDDDGEEIELGFGTLPGRVTVGSPAHTTVTITDDDERAVVVMPTTLAIEEGQNGWYTVELTSQPTGAVEVRLGVSNRSGAATVTADRAELTFTANNWAMAQTVTVRAEQDDDVLDGVATIAHEVTGADYEGEPASQVEVTVSDDDELPSLTIVGAVESVTEGQEARFTVRRSGDHAKPLSVGLAVSQEGDYIAGVVPRTVRFAADAATAELTVATEDDTTDEADGSISVAITEGADYESGEPSSAQVYVNDDDAAPGMTIADGTVVESAGEIRFAVRLAAASGYLVTVVCVSEDGTALAGEDYTAERGTLTIMPGETAGTIAVAVLDDSRPELDESFAMVLTDAVHATLERGTATGTIVDDDAVAQQVWLSRFGRTVATHVVEAVGGRLGPAWEPSSQVTVAGRRLEAAATDEERPDPFAPGAVKVLQPSELLKGSSFSLSAPPASPEAGAGPWSTWGRGAVTQLAGKTDEVSLSDGVVATVGLGADYDWGAILGGLAVFYSGGESTFEIGGSEAQPERGGEVESWLISAHPYLRVELTDRLAAWGLLGYGLGASAVVANDDREQRIETDTRMMMGAFEVRGELLALPHTGGVGMTVKSDGFLVRMSTNPSGGLSVLEADASRLRLVLEGVGKANLGAAGSLSPSLELGLRHDDGDAETGFGAELGGGLRFIYPAWGLTLSANGRVLVTHEAKDYAEWGAGGSLRWAPGGSGRGPQLGVTSSWGAEQSGVERLWSVGDAGDLLGIAGDAEGRLAAELGYGVTVGSDETLLTPYLGVELIEEDTRSFRIGSTLAVARYLKLRLEAIRREPVATPPEHRMTLQADIRW